MSSRTLAQLRTECRERADMEGSLFVSDTELTRMINQSIKDLYDVLVDSRTPGLYVASSSAATTAGVDAYNLPATFYRMLGVDIDIGGPTKLTARPFVFDERNAYESGWGPGFSTWYMIRGGQIVFLPSPDGAYTYTLWFVPLFVDLSADGDTFDGINGWEEYVVVDVAAKMLEKEESDARPLYKRKAELLQRIEAAASRRDDGHPPRVTDVQRRYDGWGG